MRCCCEDSGAKSMGAILNGFVSSHLFEKQEFHCLNLPLLFLYSLLTSSYTPGAHLQFNLDFVKFVFLFIHMYRIKNKISEKMISKLRF